ncbi:MAG: hypothetical protein ABSG65_10625 [Bryobacteraceae bacterium]|jgi:hypothetical protein
MKKSLLAIVFAAATLPLTFAQNTAPAPNQSTATQKSTAKKTKKTASKHSTKKSTTSTTATTPPQK